MSEDPGACPGCGSLNACQGECQEGPKPASAFIPVTELRKCQDKLRKMRHELRCIHEAHQRLLFANADLKRNNKAILKRSHEIEEAYYKKIDYKQKGPIRRAVHDFGMFLWRATQ